MAQVNGKLCSCDRCEKTIFLRCTGEGERDGGFTRWNKFEPYPDGWEWHSDTGQLCPECNAIYKKLVEDFKSKVEKFKQKGE